MAITVANALTYARQLLQTDSNGLTDTLGLAFANDALENITRTMFERGIDAAQTGEAYTTLLPSDNPPGQFPWPSDMYALKTVEVNWNSSAQTNYLQAQPVDVSNIQFVSFDYLRVNQPTTWPLFDNRGDTGELFPTPTVSTLIRIFYFKLPTEYTATSDSIVYPISLDYRCLAARVAALYALSQNQTGMKNRYTVSIMTSYENEYQTRLKDLVNILAPSSQQPTQPTPLQITGWNY